MEKKKVVWILNEYNGPNAGTRTRQIVLSQYLREKGYDTYIIAGSADYKHGPNYMDKSEKIKCVNYDGETFYVIRTDNYSSNIQRVFCIITVSGKIVEVKKAYPSSRCHYLRFCRIIWECSS